MGSHLCKDCKWPLQLNHAMHLLIGRVCALCCGPPCWAWSPRCCRPRSWVHSFLQVLTILSNPTMMFSSIMWIRFTIVDHMSICSLAWTTIIGWNWNPKLSPKQCMTAYSLAAALQGWLTAVHYTTTMAGDIRRWSLRDIQVFALNSWKKMSLYTDFVWVFVPWIIVLIS